MASTVDGERDLFDDDDDGGGDSEFDTEGDDDPCHAAAPPSAAALSPVPIPILSFPPAAALDLTHFLNPNPIPDPLLHPALTGAVQPFPSLLYPAAAPSTDRKRPHSAAAASEESRRVFQKIWKDEDEIAILQGFLDFTTQRGTTHADYQYDTGPFFDEIRTRLQLDFHRNQLVEKLRRLKRKYRNAAARIAAGKEHVFKSAHDRATYEISQKIWSSSFKRVRKGRSSDAAPAPQSAEPGINGAAPESAPEIVKQEAAGVAVTVVATPAVPAPVAPTPAPFTSSVEETVKNSLSPLFKELIQCVSGGLDRIAGGVLAFGSPLQLNIPGLGQPAGMEERWKQQQILELEVLLKRSELVKEQIKAALEELKTPGVAEERSS